jgi:hypothetical protein
MTTPLSPAEQHHCLCVLDMLSDLFTESPKQSFTSCEILHLLNVISNDPELFEPDVVIAHQIAIQEIDAQEDAL